MNFSGFVDGYYSFNFNHPASGTNTLRNFDVRANSFSLNMAMLKMNHAPDPIGFQFDVGLGRGMEIFHSFEPKPGVQDVVRNIFQAYVSVKPKNAGGFQFDFGKFVTSAGAEPTESYLNWNYSRSLLFANGPYYHFGARISKPINDHYTAGFQLVNGWNNVDDNNSGKTFGLTHAITSSKVSLYQTYYAGPEKTLTNEGYRHFIDTVLSLTPHEKAAFTVNFDYGVDKRAASPDPNSEFYGIAVASRLAANNWLAFSPRVEWYNDKNGFITGQIQKLKEFTLTAEMKMTKGFVSKIEYRRDWSDQPYFDRGNQTGNAKTMDTLLVGFVAFFGE